jgi:peroxiredoxin
MKYKCSCIVFLLTALHFSCKQPVAFTTQNEDPKKVLKDFNSFWNYYYKYTDLSAEFIAVDEVSNIITKERFLQSLSNGNYIPFRLKSEKDLYYQLYKLPADVNRDISNTVVSAAQREYKFLKLEGKPLGEFNLVDLNGIKYNTETTKGNILVLKCWFIHCQKCNEEIPECNKLVAKFSNNTHIKFISLAFDNEQDLNKFLANTKLDYAVVANQEKYLTEAIGIDSYPTHIIINDKGIVTKVLNDFNLVEPALNKAIENIQKGN